MLNFSPNHKTKNRVSTEAYTIETPTTSMFNAGKNYRESRIIGGTATLRKTTFNFTYPQMKTHNTIVLNNKRTPHTCFFSSPEEYANFWPTHFYNINSTVLRRERKKNREAPKRNY